MLQLHLNLIATSTWVFNIPFWISTSKKGLGKEQTKKPVPKVSETRTVCTICPRSHHLVSFQPHKKHEAAFWQSFSLPCLVLSYHLENWNLVHIPLLLDWTQIVYPSSVSLQHASFSYLVREGRFDRMTFFSELMHSHTNYSFLKIHFWWNTSTDFNICKFPSKLNMLCNHKGCPRTVSST